MLGNESHIVQRLPQEWHLVVNLGTILMKKNTWYILHHLAFVQFCLLMLWIPLKGELAVGEAAHVVVQLEGDHHQVLKAWPVVG